MKRIKAACICQTLHFMLKDDIAHSLAERMVKEEVQQYKKRMENSRIKYRILEETEQEDGSVIMKVVKQYNQSPVGEYLD